MLGTGALGQYALAQFPATKPPAPPPALPQGGHGDYPRRRGKSPRPIWDIAREAERKAAEPPTVIEIAPEPIPAAPHTETSPAALSQSFLNLPHETAALPPFAYSLPKPKPAAKRTALTHREAQEIMLIALAALEDEDDED